ncbi:uncharacterized protein LOC127244231 [Andrographis paniculata]|uniref:uncharacterized protein LOC127244231 n=1 Tax=Andrographis paniculata TaxID=175694 RepID=UPI0021E78961|nr:uncharacterized protein LOC127244231 [Andrographis paniculata]
MASPPLLLLLLLLLLLFLLLLLLPLLLQHSSVDYRPYYYNQTLDHFNYAPQSYSMFRQRYLVSQRHWGGSGSPILAYLGAEQPIDKDLRAIGFLDDNGPVLDSLSVFIELKYPHIAIGVLASSVSILYFDNITPQNGYYSVVTKDFKQVSESCYQTRKDSWTEIDKIALQLDGFSVLSKKFQTCRKLENSDELRDALDTMYSHAAQYNNPPVTMMCHAIDQHSSLEKYPHSDIIGRIAAGVVSYYGNNTCFVNQIGVPTQTSTQTSIGWRWQTCSEMVMPIEKGLNDTMFPPSPFYLKKSARDVKSVLSKFGSNIIFSNGLRDQYSSGRILKDLSPSTVAVTTHNGAVF